MPFRVTKTSGYESAPENVQKFIDSLTKREVGDETREMSFYCKGPFIHEMKHNAPTGDIDGKKVPIVTIHGGHVGYGLKSVESDPEIFYLDLESNTKTQIAKLEMV